MISYNDWFKDVVESGWFCDVYDPIEILANYLLTWPMVHAYTDKMPTLFIKKYITTVAEGYWLESNIPFENALKLFNDHYTDGRMDFGVFLKDEQDVS